MYNHDVSRCAMRLFVIFMLLPRRAKRRGAASHDDGITIITPLIDAACAAAIFIVTPRAI